MSGDPRRRSGYSAGPLASAVGYLRQYGSMTCRQFANARAQLSAFAEQSGLELRHIFVEELHSDPTAFEELLQVVKRRNIRTVLVPNRAHLSSVGGSESKDQRLRRETGSEVLVANTYEPDGLDRGHHTTSALATAAQRRR